MMENVTFLWYCSKTRPEETRLKFGSGYKHKTPWTMRVLVNINDKYAVFD